MEIRNCRLYVSRNISHFPENCECPIRAINQAICPANVNTINHSTCFHILTPKAHFFGLIVELQMILYV